MSCIQISWYKRKLIKSWTFHFLAKGILMTLYRLLRAHWNFLSSVGLGVGGGLMGSLLSNIHSGQDTPV